MLRVLHRSALATAFVVVAPSLLPTLDRAAPREHRALTVGATGTVTRLAGQTHWRAGSIVTLRGPLLVPAEAALDIEPGVTVEAAPGASIVVERNGRLNITGTRTEPVVLTCPNNARTPGCWDGLVVLGHAPINHGALTSPAGGRGGAGGCRESTLDGAAYGGCSAEDSSGTIQFLRVQYATHGVRLFGVGSRTVVQDIQVHRSPGHGLEVVGGTARLRHLALTTNAQYGLVYSGGWTGQAQYVVIQQDATGYAGGLLGRNAQGAGGNQNATPRSAPTLANLTIVAPLSAAGNPYASAAPAALRFDRGAAGRLYNVLLIEPAIAVDVDDAATCIQATGGTLRMQGAGLTAPTNVADPDADPAECAPAAEAGLLAGATTVTGAAAATQLQSALDVVLPDLRARPGSVIALASGVAPPVAGIVQGVTHLGAIAPAASTGSIPWYSGWTIGEQLAAPALVTLNGVVTAPGRGGIAGVTVRVSPSGQTATSTALGQFTIAGVPAGPVEVAFTGGVPADCTTPEVVRAVAHGATMTLAEVRLTCGPPAPSLVPTSLSVGLLHSCGLTSAGAAYCWGLNNSGQLGNGTTTQRTAPTLVTGAPAFVAVSAGGQHTCGLTNTGAIYCWGNNAFGQLGDGTTANRLTPTLVSGGLVFASLTGGGLHTCGVATSGAAYCWGSNFSGVLGDGTTVQRLTPTLVSGGQSFRVLEAGNQHTCGLTGAGVAYCWGLNEGRLGDGNFFERSSPTPVSGGLTFATISAGFSHTCAVTSAGAAYCWGDNTAGRLGVGTTAASFVPIPVSGGQSFTSVSIGQDHTCGVTTLRAVYCWGRNVEGQLGLGTTVNQSVPTRVSGGAAFATVSAGQQHTCGLTTAGTALCWGGNLNGQLGDFTTSGRLAPVAANGAPAFVTLAAGNNHTCGRTSTGAAAYCWGANGFGSLGDGTNTQRNLPAPVSGGLTFSSLDAGESHTCGLTTLGVAYCWGSNEFGQLGDGTNNTPRLVPQTTFFPFVTLVTGALHTCGVFNAAGATYCWGNNDVGQVGFNVLGGDALSPALVSGGLTFTSLAAGSFHTCGLTSGGTAFCWGDNGFGKLGDGTAGTRLTPTPVSGGLAFTTLAAGSNHTCGLTSAGAAYCWGGNSDGQLGDGTTTNRFTPTLVSGGLAFSSLITGDFHTCGLTSAGVAYCWGRNVDGQLGDGTTALRVSPRMVSGGRAFTSLTAGRHHTCALTSAGTASCWGDNFFGQLGDGTENNVRLVPVFVGIAFRVP